MSCPAWEQCNKKHCIETEHCRNPNYWASLSSHVLKRSKKAAAKLIVEAALCSKVGGICDKDTTCKFLGQCIFTINAVKGNKKLIKALNGRHNAIGQVLAILKEHNPKPMISDYLHSKNKK